jgi:HK97 family phage prohead protease
VPDVMTREVVREDLTRTAPFTARDDAGDGLTLDGYGAVFDAETVIDSWEGMFREVLARGCFKKSLRERTPRMQFDHGRHPLIGSIPIGTFDEGYPVEDDEGLHCVGRLADNWLVQPVRDAIASGAVDGMSFRFSVVRESWALPNGTKLSDPRTIAEFLWRPPEDGLLLRTVQEVKLTEVGPVVWPAYTQTTVGVRDAVIDLARLHEPATRRLLAQAVLIADAHDGEAQHGSTTARPRSSAPLAPARHTPSGVPVGSDHDAPGEHRTPTRQDEPAHLRSDLSRWLSARRVKRENLEGV